MEWITGILTVVSLVVSIIQLFNPSSTKTAKPDNARPGSFDFPTATEDRLVPEVFGEVAIFSPNFIHDVGVHHSPIEKVEKVKEGGKGGGSKKVRSVVGYAIEGTFLLGVAARTDALTGFYFERDLVWSGIVADNSGVLVKTGKSAPQNGSGRSRSVVVYRSGAQTSFPAYASRTGEQVPYFGTTLLWFNGAFLGDNVQSVPAYGARVRRIVDAVAPLGTGKAGIVEPVRGLVGQNPADMLWHILTEWMSIDPSQLDEDSFAYAKDALHAEQLGFHALIDEPDSADEMTREILRHIDGQLYWSTSSRKWRLKLIRNDFVLEDTPVLTPSHYNGLELTRESWEELPTRLEVKVLDLNKWELTAVEVDNPSVAFHVGSDRKKSVSFPWIGGQPAIRALVARLQRRYWLPNAIVQFSLPPNLTDPRQDHLPAEERDLWLPEEGDVVRVSYDDPLGANSFENLVVRVTGVLRGDGDKGVSIEGVEDNFSASNVQLIDFDDDTPSGPDYNLPDPPARVIAVDATPEMSEVSAFAVLAAPPAGAEADGYNVQVDGSYIYGAFEFQATAELSSDWGEGVGWADYDATMLLEDADESLAEFTTTDGAWQRELHRAVVHNHNTGAFEVVSVRELEDLGDGNWRATGFVRDIAGTGWTGTQLRSFPAGCRVWFLQGERDFAAVLPVLDSLGVSKTLDVVAVNHYDSSPAETISHTYGFTVETPYPPGFAQVEKVGSGPGQSHVLTWAAHTRHQGAVGVNADNIPVFDADAEGQWEISIPAMSSFTPVVVDEPTWTRTGAGASAVTYLVRSLLDGRFSTGAQVTAPAD